MMHHYLTYKGYTLTRISPGAEGNIVHDPNADIIRGGVESSHAHSSYFIFP